MEKSRGQTEHIVLKYSLQNAVFYNGHANAAAVLGKVMAKEPGLRKNVGEVKAIVDRTVKEINALSLSEQKKRLRKIAPSMLEREIKKQEALPILPGAKKRIVTRFAPSPTGPLNLTQLLRAGMLSYLYAEKYRGRFILRIDDTDPRNIEKDFYDWIKQDLRSVGIKWDRLVIESDDMKAYYKYAEKLLQGGKAYVCSCPPEAFRNLKLDKRDCRCRSDSGENLKKWKKMLKREHKEGKAVVRLKTSMKDPNPALRDPVLLRIIKAKHPRKGRKFSVWPVYNYACVIEDHKSGVTHVFRGKEHEHNTRVQEKIYTALGWEPPRVINFGMIYLPGKKIHTRDIKQGIKEGIYSGWDDPKLPTIRALLRRGFQPEAFKDSAIACSLSKTDIVFNWESLEAINRRVLDPNANRYMVVFDPVKISLKNYPKVEAARINMHPDFPKRGKREVPLRSFVYISGTDFKALRGKEIRLKGLFNVRLVSNMGVYSGDEIVTAMPKIQWVSEPNAEVVVIKPEGKAKGLGEPAMKKLKPGEMIQMERVGFARVDSKNRHRVTLYFAHK